MQTSGALRELGIAFIEHSFEEGNIISSQPDISDYPEMCEFRCDDCGLTRKFNSLSNNLPVWLMDRLVEIQRATA